MAKTYQELDKLAKDIHNLTKEQGFTENLIVLGDPSTGQMMIISNGKSSIIQHMDHACHTIRDLHGGIEMASNDSSTQN